VPLRKNRTYLTAPAAPRAIVAPPCTSSTCTIACEARDDVVAEGADHRIAVAIRIDRVIARRATLTDRL
jgi:hypothetical protein